MKLFVLLICLFVGKIVDCCSCIPLDPIDDKQYNEYSVIAKGKVLKITEHNFQRTIYLKVGTYYKGQQKQSIIKLIAPSQEGNCGILPKVGEHWLMFAYADGKIYRTNLCTRTKSMNYKAWNYDKVELANDLKFLEAKLTNNGR